MQQMFFAGFVTMLVELTVARILDFTLNSAMAWLCLSLAIFGIGLSALALPFVQKRSNPWRRTILALGVLLLLFPALFGALPLAGPLAPVAYAALMILISAPFFFGGLAILILLSSSRDVSKLYFADLTGAAVGAGLAVAMVPLAGPGRLMFGAGLLCLAAALSHRRAAAAAVLVLGGATLFLPDSWWDFEVHTEKRYSRFLRENAPEVSLWTANSKIDVVNTADGAKQIVFDGGDMVSTIYPFDGDYAGLRASPARVAREFWSPGIVASHFLKAGTGATVLAVGAAGGQEIKAALTYGASLVDVAELVGELLDFGRGRYAEFNGGIFLRPEVRLHARDGRRFLRAHPENKYDIIQLSSVHASSSRGSSMGALQASYLVTEEAFTEYFSHLKEDGILHLNYFYYPRLISTMAAAWNKLGAGPLRAHAVVIESRGARWITTVLVKMKPWSVAEIYNLRALFSVGTPHYTLKENPIGAGTLPEEFFSGHPPSMLPYRAEAATDNHPFFKFLRRHFWGDPKMAADSTIPPDIQAYLTRWKIWGMPGDLFPLRMAGIGLAALIALALAAAFFTLRPKGGAAGAFYFFFAGCGFMAVEMFCIYRSGLLVDSPHLALALSLTALLLGAGLGSAFSGRVKNGSSFWPALSVPPLAFVTLAGLTPLSHWAAGFPQWMQMFIVFAGLLPLGFSMGMPFPLGLRLFQGTAWAWLLNGAGAAAGGYLAVVLALYSGFTAVGLAGAAAYLGAAVVLKTHIYKIS